jgi:hypothetical protein
MYEHEAHMSPDEALRLWNQYERKIQRQSFQDQRRERRAEYRRRHDEVMEERERRWADLFHRYFA